MGPLAHAGTNLPSDYSFHDQLEPVKECAMLPGILLWLLGAPLVVIVLLYLVT